MIDEKLQKSFDDDKFIAILSGAGTIFLESIFSIYDWIRKL